MVAGERTEEDKDRGIKSRKVQSPETAGEPGSEKPGRAGPYLFVVSLRGPLGEAAAA